ncbi:hypothetical protein [Zhongshania sp.]|jgi:hypothetical protein|nr:hypothetical protein [Zhongshania sp.]
MASPDGYELRIWALLLIFGSDFFSLTEKLVKKYVVANASTSYYSQNPP